MKFLITAGPTREPIDAVRYISNFSSGKMGYALAKTAYQRRHRVTLISGPVNMPPLRGVRSIPVTTALEMRKAVLKYLPSADCLIMAAAVGDYRPARIIKGKTKKTKEVINLKLVRNPDILKEVGRKFRNKILVGFALESDNLIKNAHSKLKGKRLDYIVANTPSAFGRDRTDVLILDNREVIKRFRHSPKSRVADYLIKLLEKQWTGLPPSS